MEMRFPDESAPTTCSLLLPMRRRMYEGDRWQYIIWVRVSHYL